MLVETKDAPIISALKKNARLRTESDMDMIVGHIRHLEFFKDKVGDVTLKIAGPAKEM